MIADLVARTRTCRRFRQEIPVPKETLVRLVDLARLAASSANLQPLLYLPSCDPARNETIFGHLAWAGYLKGWPGPAEGERPAAYVVVLGDTEIADRFAYDAGLAIQNLLLGATEAGLRGCILGSVDREGLRRRLAVPVRYRILLVVALGVPAETVELESVGPDGDVRYWRDGSGVHHVPKRALADIVVDWATG